MAETILIELVVDDSQLQPAIDLLEKTGQIDSKLANSFKQTTTEINKQAAAIKQSAEATAPLNKNLEDVSKVIKNTTSAFVEGFQEGVTETLKEAGVSIIQLKKALGTFNQGSPFDKLNKSLSDTTKRVLDASARLEQLRRTGGAGTEAFNKLEKQLVADQQELRKLSDELARVKQATDVLNEEPANTGGAVNTLRKELKEVTIQLQKMELAGENNTEEFRQLTDRAGKLRDAIRGVNEAVSRIGDGELAIRAVGEAAQGLTGVFAVTQGIVGLTGDESEELQKTLLKVNSAMAVLQGLQAVSNVLQKESNLMLGIGVAQRKIQNAQIVIENGLNSTSIIVRGAATVAQKALNAAMSANPIGIVVTALAGLITLLSTYGRSAAEARRQTSNLNVALDAGAKAFEDRANAIKQQGDETIKNLELEGAVGSKIAQQEVDNQALIINARKERLAELQALEASNTEADLKKRQELNAAIRALDDQLLADTLAAGNLEVRLKRVLLEEDLKNRISVTESAVLAAEEGSKEQLDIQKRLISQKAQLEANADGLLESQRAEIFNRAAEQILELQAAFDKRRIDLQLKNIEAQLINVREGSQEELNLRLRQLRLQVQSEISSTKLSEAEKKAIKEKGFQDQLKLQREFNERVRREAIEGQIALNAAELANVQINSEDKLLLTIANIELAAAVEVDAANGNANKIKEINAKRDADIAATRKAFIEKQAEDEIALITATAGVNNRALQRIAENEKQSVRTRIIAIQQLAQFDIGVLERREKALEDQLAKGLITEAEYNLRYAILQDEKAKIAEDTEKKITGLHKSEAEKRKQTDLETIAQVINVSQQVIGVLESINDLRASQGDERLKAERERVAELLESGAITEKEAIARQKRLDIEEKRLRAQQAQREKQIAVFKAVLAIPQAYLTGLTQGGPIVGAIYAALAAVQAAIVIAKPIPKFRTGKKGSYEGPGIIGEAGQEIFEHDGKRYLAHKETLVWLGKNDKVYTPQETKRMLPSVDKELMKHQPETAGLKEIDYDHLAKAVGKEVGKQVRVPGLTVDENGFKVWQQEGLSRTRYMDKYYSSK